MKNSACAEFQLRIPYIPYNIGNTISQIHCNHLSSNNQFLTTVKEDGEGEKTSWSSSTRTIVDNSIVTLVFFFFSAVRGYGFYEMRQQTIFSNTPEH